MQLVKIQNANQLTDIIHSLVTGSFEKKFKGVKPADIVNAFAFATQGLSQEQIQTGIKILLDKGFCPDPALFRQWCLGNRDFTFADEIADSYVGKNGALNNIIAWLENDKTTAISTAEKQAYDACYTLWQGIHSEKDRQKAELAFKDFYEKRVAELVKARVPCQAYIAPVAIAAKDAKKDVPASREYAMSILQNIGRNLKQKFGEAA